MFSILLLALCQAVFLSGANSSKDVSSGAILVEM